VKAAGTKQSSVHCPEEAVADDSPSQTMAVEPHDRGQMAVEEASEKAAVAAEVQ
jgi:hypothetical protein